MNLKEQSLCGLIIKLIRISKFPKDISRGYHFLIKAIKKDMDPLSKNNKAISTGEGIEAVPLKSLYTAEGLKKKFLDNLIEERIVIVHCSVILLFSGWIRVRKDTFLFDHDSGIKKPLTHAFNIPVAPEYREVKAGTSYRFTLIFGPLPDTCEFFDLVESAPLSSAITAYSIKRNKEDIYSINIMFL